MKIRHLNNEWVLEKKSGYNYFDYFFDNSECGFIIQLWPQSFIEHNIYCVNH